MHVSTPRTRRRLSHEILIGKDILELLSSAMYADPLSIYREYVQNSADAIDEARHASLYHGPKQPKIEITLDPLTRSSRIRDNGIGVEAAVFSRRMTSLGASKKRGSLSRGFRGVGRLSGLGYCQELIMRSKAAGDSVVSEIRWDCRRFKEILRDNTFRGNLEELFQEVVTLDVLDAKHFPSHFFEVEMLNVIRYKNDQLLNEESLATYLSQTAPVPFSPGFTFGSLINDKLHKLGLGAHYKIYLNDDPEPIFRPFQNEFPLNPQVKDRFTNIEFHDIPAIADGLDAVGWILHHSYRGALPDNLQIKGLRLRIGNTQVGSDAILQALFPEPRFNSWVIGEFHIVPSARLVPNGRRDDFEHNNHYSNLQNHITVIARDLAKTCRSVSAERNQRRLELSAVHSSTALIPKELEGFMTKEEQKIVQSLPKPQAIIYNHLLPLIVRFSPTSKTAHRIISGLIGELTLSQAKRVAST